VPVFVERHGRSVTQSRRVIDNKPAARVCDPT
jgi:hypothetical protein